MPLESNVNYISDLNPAWPTGGDAVSYGDNNLRNLKTVLLNCFPLFKGPVPIANDQFVSKSDLMAAQFSSVLPGQPGGTITYTLESTNGNATWQPRRAIFDDTTRLAQVQATALCF